MFETSVQEKVHIDFRSIIGAVASFAILVAAGYLLIVG